MFKEFLREVNFVLHYIWTTTVMKKNVILTMTFDFAKETILFCDRNIGKRNFVIHQQLMKSGTSIGANIREAQQAESRADFIHKFKIASKEAHETEYWLALVKEVYQLKEAQKMLDDLKNVRNIIAKIIISSKKNHK